MFELISNDIYLNMPRPMNINRRVPNIPIMNHINRVRQSISIEDPLNDKIEEIKEVEKSLINTNIIDSASMNPLRKSYSDLINIFTTNRIDYESLKLNSCEFTLINEDPVDLSIIVPVLGRENFTGPLIEHFQRAMEFYPEKKYSITFVEHSSHGSHRDGCSGKANHIWIKKTERAFFNKCLSMNMGVLYSNKADYYLFHDLDLLVKDDFFERLFKNLEKHSKPLQAFGGRRVVVLDDQRTNMILNKEGDLNGIVIGKEGSIYCRPGAPGGSIFIDRNSFLNAGGFDAEFFHSYSCEDAFFYDKLLVTSGVQSCNDPLIDVFHMNHPRNNGSTNPDLRNQRNIHEGFEVLSQEEQKKFIEFIANKFLENFK